MTTIESMRIQGIRSFDPRIIHEIKFFKPLTLVVGPNGAGKTTIIECLKILCTGELPATSGHFFIHDPRVAGQKETKAAIHLNLRSRANTEVVAIRNFHLSLKDCKMELKQETLIQTKDAHTDENKTDALRCPAMEQEMLKHLEVSKAILENVILVRQDEFNWPLDPSMLTKKVDDIFSSTQFMNILEGLKKISKTHTDVLDTSKLNLKKLGILKDEAHKLQERIAQDQEQTASLKLRAQQLQRSIDHLDAESQHVLNNLLEINKLETEAETHKYLKSQRDSCIQNLFIRNSLGSLPTVPFSDEDALNLTNRIESRLVDLEKDLEKKRVTLRRNRGWILSRIHKTKRLNLAYENGVEQKRRYQDEVEALLGMTSKIKEYSDLKKADKLKELQETFKFGGDSTFIAELDKISQEKLNLFAELIRCNETISNLESSISRNMMDLEHNQYMNLEEQLSKGLEKIQEREEVIEQLDKYRNALDKILMAYYKSKIEEINEFIRDLWQQSYTGQDISCIRIHLDSEGAGTRSHSYKVLMQTSGAELEMRGRCSPGQKVLACLVIRLAFAKMFCYSSCMLALDEPTADLDRANAKSVADAILRILEIRKNQENFQLIVCTRDEHFAQLIGRGQLADRYYRHKR